MSLRLGPPRASSSPPSSRLEPLEHRDQTWNRLHSTLPVWGSFTLDGLEETALGDENWKMKSLINR
jgi:hypothetical protein